MYYNLLKQEGVPARNQTRRHKVHCPQCEMRKGKKPKTRDLTVDPIQGWWKCHSASCDFKGQVHSKRERAFKRPPKLPKYDLHTEVVKFCKDRCLDPQTAVKLGWRYDEGKLLGKSSQKGVVFPYFRNGELINAKKRIQLENDKTYRQVPGAEKILYNLDSLRYENEQGEIAIKRKCLWVEGEVDVASFAEALPSSQWGIVSLDQGAGQPGSKLDGKLQCIDNCAEILMEVEHHYLCLDHDAPGQYTQAEVARRLGEYKCSIVKLPKGKKDANEVLKDETYDKDVRLETLSKAVQDAYQVEPRGAVVIDDDMRDDMIDRFEEGWQMGTSLNFPSLDPYFRFLRGNMTFVYGWPNSGKGTFVRYLMVKMAIRYGWKWSVFSGEDGSARLLADRLCSMYLGQDCIKDREDVDKERYIEALDFVRRHFFFIIAPRKSRDIKPSNEWLNSITQYFKLKFGVNAFVKDPWFLIYHDRQGRREDEYLQDELANEMAFCENYDAAIYIDHPLNPKRPYSKNLPRPTPDLLRGGGSKWMITDNLICVYRQKHKDGSDSGTVITFNKIRDQERVGVTGEAVLRFNPSKQRFYGTEISLDPLEMDLKEVRMNGEKEEMKDEDLPF